MERCPVCRARLKEEAACPRCGADLSALLAIEAEATAWEREAVTLLAAGAWIEARRAAELALALRHSPLASVARDFAGRELVAEARRRFKQLLQ
jgi:predicted amidophosphoribosyltransferase